MNSDRRVPFFERPRPPRDWRWTVGGIGRIFITMGILMFAFVGYQLWGTGIQTAQAQHTLDRQFNDLLKSTTTTSTTSTSSTSPVSTEPQTTQPPTTQATTTTIPVAPSGPPVAKGSAVARLKIASIGLDYTVVEGVGVPDLKKGPGHFPETPMPGQLGNAAIAGHRTTYGHPFLDLDNLKVGDLIEISTVTGTYVYSVTGTTVVSPAQYADVIPTVDPNVATLTLATCTPAYTARQRLIVKATLVPDKSSQVFAPPSVTAPGAATTVPTPTTTETIPGDTQPDTTTPNSSDTSSTGVPATTVASTPPSGGDAFANGWFDDASAIPHTLLWGLALALVVGGAFFIGKRANRLWVSFLAGAVPFLVVLYFLFENVNRLLPSSI